MTKNHQPPDSSDFYKLIPTEFERLVADVFSQSGYSNVKLIGGPGDQGVDILATKDNRQFAIQVKHKSRLNLQELQRFVDYYFSNSSTPRNLIFVTSAELPKDISSLIERIPDGAQFEIVDRSRLLQMVQAHQEVSAQVIAHATQRQRSQKFRLSLSYIAGLCSILGLFISFYSVFHPNKAPLDKRIETVEKALGSMRDLERYLSDIKRDMEDTQKATAIINQKYAEAKELEKLTAAQLSALQATLKGQNWRWTVLNYVFGFILGVASSLFASVLYARWQQRKALE